MDIMPGVQFEEVWNAINSAYDKGSLDKMLRFRLDRRLDHIATDGPVPDMTFELLSAAQREGWHVELLKAAHSYNPRNVGLAEVYEKYGLAPQISIQQHGNALESAPTSVSASGFERTIKGHNPLFDIAIFREGLASVEGWVCRIRLNGNSLGTGFLIGPDLVMTNYHVMQNIIAHPERSAGIRCQFDYKRLSDGSRQNGVEVALHNSDWNVSYSKFSPAEEAGTPDSELPTPDQLDYSVVRLSAAIGSKPIGVEVAGAPQRSWVKFPDTFPTVTPPVPLIIVQHPDGAPLKVAMDTDGIKSANSNSTRVRYDVTTESGSSGSPCFDFRWQPVAIHHYGDPGSEFHKPNYNQGIPFAIIREHLRKNGHGDIL